MSLFLLCCAQSSVTEEKMATFAEEEFKRISLWVWAALSRHPSLGGAGLAAELPVSLDSTLPRVPRQDSAPSRQITLLLLFSFLYAF